MEYIARDSSIQNNLKTTILKGNEPKMERLILKVFIKVKSTPNKVENKKIDV